jgi:hypothetical protein
MSLHVVIGFDRRGASATPALVYLGRSGSEAEAAMKADTQHACFLRVANPSGITKNNPNFVAPAAPVERRETSDESPSLAAEVAAGEPAASEPPEKPASPKRRDRRAEKQTSGE